MKARKIKMARSWGRAKVRTFELIRPLLRWLRTYRSFP